MSAKYRFVGSIVWIFCFGYWEKHIEQCLPVQQHCETHSRSAIDGINNLSTWSISYSSSSNWLILLTLNRKNRKNKVCWLQWGFLLLLSAIYSPNYWTNWQVLAHFYTHSLSSFNRLTRAGAREGIAPIHHANALLSIVCATVWQSEGERDKEAKNLVKFKWDSLIRILALTNLH